MNKRNQPQPQKNKKKQGQTEANYLSCLAPPFRDQVPTI